MTMFSGKVGAHMYLLGSSTRWRHTRTQQLDPDRTLLTEGVYRRGESKKRRVMPRGIMFGTSLQGGVVNDNRVLLRLAQTYTTVSFKKAKR